MNRRGLPEPDPIAVGEAADGETHEEVPWDRGDPTTSIPDSNPGVGAPTDPPIDPDGEPAP